MTTVPGCIALLFFDQWVPLFLLIFGLGSLTHLLLHLLADGEHLVELCSLGSHGTLLLRPHRLRVGLGLRLLRRRCHLALLLLGGPEDAVVRLSALALLRRHSERLKPRLLRRFVRFECETLAIALMLLLVLSIRRISL